MDRALTCSHCNKPHRVHCDNPACDWVVCPDGAPPSRLRRARKETS